MSVADRLRRGFALLATLALCACTTMQPVDVGRAMRSPPPAGVDYGSLIEVRTIDGERARFRVTEMTPEGLGGSGAFYRYDEMERLTVQRKRDGGGDAMAIIGGLLGVAALVWLIGNADDVRVCSPGPCPPPNP